MALVVSWMALLDVRTLIAGRDGDPLVELNTIYNTNISLGPRG